MIRLWRWALRRPLLVLPAGVALLLVAVALYGQSGEQAFGDQPGPQPEPLGTIAFVSAVVAALSGLVGAVAGLAGSLVILRKAIREPRGQESEAKGKGS